MDKTLLLNSTYEPLLIISWQKAITLLVLDKVEVLASYERDIRSATASIKLPSVVRLYNRVRYRPTHVRFNRANIYARDKHTCQYCGDMPGAARLTYDHVVPKSRGGRNSWTNIVTCCQPCNRRKGNRTPEEARMSLMNKPAKPGWLPVIGKTQLGGTMPDSWRPFLWS